MGFDEFIKKSQELERSYKITTEIYELFQKCSGDMNPLHTNREFAQRKGYDTCVMYGNILNVFISHFVGMSLPSPDVMIQTQDIQFRKPVWLGDEIIIKSVIDRVSKAVEVVRYSLKFYRISSEQNELVATGHVQIGMIHNKY